jgi:EAL domain-containing protein (putative c-di-GMP-specific phosphodiesterase class I)
MDFDRDWPWFVGVTLCAFAAIGIAAYAFGSGTMPISLMAGAIIALALGQFIAQFGNMSAGRSVKNGYAALVKDRGRMAQDLGNTLQQTSELRGQTEELAEQLSNYRAETAASNTAIAQGFAELRESHNAITSSLKSLLERPAPEPMVRTIHYPAPEEMQWRDLPLPPQPEFVEHEFEKPDASAAIAMPAPAPLPGPVVTDDTVPFGDALNLAMEPIVDLYTSQTAHYRMVLGMINDAGQEVPHDVFVHYADRTNARPALDVFVAGEALAILAQLRKRDPKLSVFIPVGASTLASPDSVYKILDLLKQSPDLATGLVVDVAHAVLASLPESSIEGLALLARSGVVLSLSNAAISGVDLASLGKLNVRFIGLNASNLGLGGNTAPELSGFVQSARALRIQVVVSQVADPRQVENLGRIARYACGAAFAAPRRLRRNGQPTLRAVA